MPHRLNRQSPLTNEAVILFYYGLGMLSLLMGFTGLLACMGACFSRSLAREFNDDFAQIHCTWIIHSVVVAYSFWVVISFLIFAFVLLCDISFPHGFSFQFLDVLKESATLKNFYYIIMALLGVLMCASLWFVYRMVRGAYHLVHMRLPKEE